MATRQYRTSEQAWDAADEGTWARLHAVEIAADVAEATRERTPRERLERLERHVDALRASWYDGGAASEADVREAETEARALRAEIEAAEDAAFLAAWPRELTLERRAVWNARVQAGEFGGAAVDPRTVRAAEQAQGWTVNDLRRAVALHGL